MPVEANGSLRPWNTEEVAAFELDWRGLRDGGTPTESFEVNATRADMKLWCKWDKRYDVVNYLVGYQVVWDDGGTKKISRQIPQRYPGTPALWCTKVAKITGHAYRGNDTDGFPKYARAELDVIFEAVPYEVASDAVAAEQGERARYVDDRADSDPTTEAITFPGGAMKFHRDPLDPVPDLDPDGRLCPFNISKPYPVEKVFVDWYRVPDDIYTPGSDWWNRLKGQSEDDDVPILGAINKAEIFGRPIGTLLLAGVKPAKDFSPTGNGRYEFRLRFEFWEKLSGWNWYYYAVANSSLSSLVNGWYFAGSGGRFATAAVVKDGEATYNARDFNDLFRP